MAILINDTAPRAQYTATSGQTVFTVPFEFFVNSDLKVYKNATLLTLTTNYTVTGAGVTGGGSVTFVTGATAGDIVTIVRDVPVSRTSDFPTSGPFNIEALNTDLDRLTAMVQQQETLDGRSLRLGQFDTPNTFNELPVKADRVGRVLQFNASTGQPEAGPTTSEIANAQTYATNASTSATAAAASASTASSAASSTAGSVAAAAASASAASTSASNASTSASNASTSATNAASSASTATTQATNSAASAALANDWATKTSGAVAGGEFSAKYHAQAAATSASNASTSASNAASSASSASAAQTAAESARDATLAAYDNFDDRYLGTKTSNPTLDNDGNALVAGALYFNSVAGEMRLYTGSSWVAAYVSGAGFLALSGGTMTGDLVVNTNGATNAVRITQTGTGNAFVVEDSTNPDSTPFVVDASGRVLIGATSAPFSNVNLGLYNSVVGTAPAVSDFYKDRAGAIVNNADGIGRIRFFGYDGATYLEAARIDSLVDGAPGTNDMPANLRFLTTADGASTPTERMRIDSSGNVGIGTSSPSSKLAIGGNPPSSGAIAGVASSGGTSLALSDNVNSSLYVRHPAGAPATIGTDTGGSLAFATNGSTERIRIGSAGQLGIGGANYGTSGQVLTSAGSGAAPTWSAPASGFSNLQVFTSSGTFTVPAGITKVKVTVVGGGGAGGNGGGGGITGNGGGGGGASIKIVSGLTPSGTVAVTVGAGGTIGSGAGANGNSGGTSSFGAYCSATGGSGSISSTGGIGSSGDLNIKGSAGFYAANTTIAEPGGNGGSSIFGGGGLGGFSAGQVGGAGGAYGGGGGGAGTAVTNGGAGAAGVVIVEY